MFVAETALYVAIACNDRRKVENCTLHFSSHAPCLSLSGQARDTAFMYPARTIEQMIKEDFASIPEVTEVRVDVDDNNYLVSVELSDENPNRPLREKIFRKEFGLLKAFPDLQFDFDLV